MKLQLLSILLAVTVISISTPAAFGDTITFADDSQCVERDDCDVFGDLIPSDNGNLEALLAFFGIDTHPTNPVIDEEEVITQFGVPLFPPTDPPTVLETITFTAVDDTGSFNYVFGACTTASVGTLNPITQKLDWAVACLSDPNLVTIFVDGATSEAFPPAGDTVELTSCPVGCDFVPGTSIFFWLIPNSNVADFLADPASYYTDEDGDVPADDGDGPAVDLPVTNRAPLFQLDLANPGEFDQLLTFIDTDVSDPVTVFTWEDLTRDITMGPRASDKDFTDLAFIADVAFENECDLAGIDNPSAECDCFLNPDLEICIGGEFLEIDSSALLLAGFQTSAVWLIPIVVAGATAGIAAFQLRRK